MYPAGLDTLNHHHLFHFWTVVREGGVTRANPAVIAISTRAWALFA
jgi:hypothetical protein